MSQYSEIFSNSWAFVLVVLFFGGSIFIHELGHFLAARMRGLKVLRFSIGFGPRLFSWTGKDGCKYMVSLLPLGGYVALPQLADMGELEGGTADDEDVKKLPPAGCADKIIVSAAGAFFNLLFAVFLAAIVYFIGLPEPEAYTTNVVGFVPETLTDASGAELPSPAFKAGVRAGDKIVSIDGGGVENLAQIVERVAIGSGRDSEGNAQAKVEIERDGKLQTLSVNPVLISTNTATGDKIRMLGVYPAMTMKVGEVMEGSPAKKSGIREGDIVKKANGIRLYSNMQMSQILKSNGESKPVEIEIERDGKIIELSVTPQAVRITKSLCNIELPSGEGEISFIDDSDGGGIKLLECSPQFAEISDMKIGSILYAIEGKNVNTISEVNTVVNAHAHKAAIKLSLMDDGRMYDAYIPRGASSKIVAPQTRPMLGYTLENITVVSHPSIYRQFSDSIERTYNAISSLINPQSDIGISSLAGPVDIGRVIYKLSFADFALVISFAVLLNINLAILNMLPIPVLDGGHIVMAIIEKIRGGPIPAKVFAAMQGTFSILFLSLMAYIVFIGFARWKGDVDMDDRDAVQSQFYLRDISFDKHE